MSQYTLFVQRIGLVGIARTIISLKGLIILPILTKTLGASDYGIWAQILVTVSLLVLIITLGLESAIARFLSAKGKKEIGQGVITSLSVTFFTSIIATLAVFFLSDFLAITFLASDSAAEAIRLGSLLIILEGMIAVALSSFRIFGQIKRYSIIVIFQTALEIGLIAFLVLSGYGLIGAITSMLITQSIVLLLILFLIFSYAGLSFPDFSLLRPFLTYSLPLVPTAILEVMVAWSDRYVIGFFLGSASVGIYSAAYGIGGINIIFIRYIAYILAPTIFGLFDNGKIDEVKKYLSYSWKYLLMLTIPSAFGLSVLAKPLLGNLTTDEFISIGKVVVPLIAISGVLHGIRGIFSQVLHLFKKTRILAVSVSTAAALNLGLNFLLVPHWGVIAAAVTTLISYSLIAFIMYYQAGKYLKFDIHLGFIIKCVISGVVMGTVIWAYSPVGIYQLLISIVIGVIIYFIALFLLRGFNRNEIQFFVKFIKDTVGLILPKR